MEHAPADLASEPLLSVRELGKRYGEREALRGVSFDLRAGELVAVVGPNGAGKTTLLSILAGVQRQSGGELSGKATVAGPRQIGWAPQQAALYSKLTVRENLRLFARLERVAEPETAVAEMLEQTGLSARAEDRIERLSGGNRQRVNVALGLLAGPALLLLDEPSSALDPGAARAPVGVRGWACGTGEERAVLHPPPRRGASLRLARDRARGRRGAVRRGTGRAARGRRGG